MHLSGLEDCGEQKVWLWISSIYVGACISGSTSQSYLGLSSGSSEALSQSISAVINSSGSSSVTPRPVHTLCHRFILDTTHSIFGATHTMTSLGIHWPNIHTHNNPCISSAYKSTAIQLVTTTGICWWFWVFWIVLGVLYSEYDNSPIFRTFWAYFWHLTPTGHSDHVLQTIRHDHLWPLHPSHHHLCHFSSHWAIFRGVYMDLPMLRLSPGSSFHPSWHSHLISRFVSAPIQRAKLDSYHYPTPNFTSFKTYLSSVSAAPTIQTLWGRHCDKATLD